MILSSLVDASRMQFALTAMFHWLFVPLTLGLGILIAIFETKYCRTNDESWKKLTQFWSRIFAINFACGVATGIILEFEFGTNWSNYSWFVGDIFGAPLAIEGIFAFFMESTFFAVMYFGWGKVSKGFHLLSTWLTAIGANISAYWILTANAWMQSPSGVAFNPATARNEMVDFWGIVFSSTTLTKFSHSVLSGFLVAAIVVIGISCWYLKKGRNKDFSMRSIKYASVFGLFAVFMLMVTGHSSAVTVARTQPMKLAAMEGLYRGENGTPLVGIGVLNPKKQYDNDEDPYLFNISIPKGLSFLANMDFDSYVPGINDIIEGGYKYKDKNGEEKTAIPFAEKVDRGNMARRALALYGQYKDDPDTAKRNQILSQARQYLDDNFEYFGYGFLKDPKESIPNVPMTFYSFRIMVMLGGYFILFLLVCWYLLKKKIIAEKKWFLFLAVLSVPLVYICAEAGWVVAEVGRQPWTIQDLLPVQASVSGVSAGNVWTTFIIFAVLFTTLLVAELRIAFNQIKKGPEGIKWN
ncbi:MAG: cytochrome ubiquinol oxidase subunit I [Bacteroidales bacterium]|nr:cytochrome ubiquinol oxidase subunit I [Bacteroidales bacterium]MBQ2483146.1 cytochrome ubiquinol oxidase subunit I [Bacteroidales bacterium]MBQ2491783.1 cytochrome ubiquinol oxidase subunit I [Bacteroidales bacterium]MBQ4196746.1 cytochrome ubiquinol oxidase subunit I [Bacteroidales bacterium]